MKILSFISIAAALMLAGCATKPLDRAADDKVDITHFRAVNIAPIQFSADVLGTLPDNELVALEGDLRAALVKGTPGSLLTDERSAGVVRIEVTVTELNASSPTVNLLTTALLFVPFDAGGVAFEARFYEGDSAEPFARTTYRHTSTPLELRGSFSRYGHATKALHDWAEEITSGLAGTKSSKRSAITAPRSNEAAPRAAS